MSYKTWVFTLNNWTEEEWNTLREWDYTYIVVGKETGEEGTPHLQGAVTFRVNKSMKGLKELLPRAHWEKAKAPDAAFAYCKKDGDFWEDDRRVQGKRKDIDAAYQSAEQGLSKKQYLMALKPAYQALKVFEIASVVLRNPRPIAPIDVIWIHGPTGVGKTRFCFETYPDLYRVRDSKWWDGYESQEVILFDDFRDADYAFNWLLQLLDIYPLSLQTKGGWTQAQWKTVLITSPHGPTEAYPGCGEDRGQLLRRITKVMKLPIEIIDVVDPPVHAGEPDRVAGFQYYI